MTSVANVAGPMMMQHDLLYSKTNFTISDLANGTYYIGAEGTISTSASDVTAFDCRPYNSVQFFAWHGGLTGGSSPSITPGIYGYIRHSNTALRVIQQVQIWGIAAASNGGCAMLGGSVPYLATTGTAGYAYNPTTSSPILPPFCRLFFTVAGSPAGLTTGFELHFYGLR